MAAKFQNNLNLAICPVNDGTPSLSTSSLKFTTSQTIQAADHTSHPDILPSMFMSLAASC